jgi:hypothetical protein
MGAQLTQNLAQGKGFFIGGAGKIGLNNLSTPPALR